MFMVLRIRTIKWLFRSQLFKEVLAVIGERTHLATVTRSSPIDVFSVGTSCLPQFAHLSALYSLSKNSLLVHEGPFFEFMKINIGRNIIEMDTIQ